MAGEYRLRKKLGEGGFGTVYEAEHPLLRRRAAVKVLHQAAGMDSDAVQRFISEAQATHQIRSRYIVDVFSFGKLPDGRHFFVMDLLEGEPLDRYLDRELRLKVPDALQLLRPITEALDAAHAVGVVHRDLKPQNIFLGWDANGETVPKLLDFGLAKLLGQASVHTASGTPMGTPLYMSPEQARGDKIDGRSDVYALGVLTHLLLTGQLPITGESTIAVLMAHLMQTPARVSEVCGDLPPELDAPILSMLAKEPSARPASAGEALAELVRAAESAGLVVPAAMPHLPPPPPRVPEAFDDTLRPSLMPGAEFAPSSEADAERDAMVRSAETGARGRGVAWPLVALFVAVAGVATYLATRTLNVSVRPLASASTAASLSASATLTRGPPSAAVSAAVDKPAEPELPVSLVVQGAPPGALIWLGRKAIGVASAAVTLPFGNAPLELMVTAPGHEPAKLTVTPNRALDATVKLKEMQEPARRGAQPRAIPTDLESPF